MKVAVLLCCHNRRETTLRCLEGLERQSGLSEHTIEPFLVDDGSTDGTSEAVLARYPSVTIVPGDGNLYWAGGMRVAARRASCAHADLSLWLNDDVVLDQTAVRRMIDVCEELGGRSIVVGSLADPDSGAITYSGFDLLRSFWAVRLSRVEPTGVVRIIDTMNGNVVLVPREVSDQVEMFDGSFIHGMADLDFGLRARARGISVALMPTAVGTCRANQAKDAWRSRRTPLRRRLDLVRSPKNLAPRPWMTFCRRHAGVGWPVAFIRPYVRAVIGDPGR